MNRYTISGVDLTMTADGRMTVNKKIGSVLYSCGFEKDAHDFTVFAYVGADGLMSVRVDKDAYGSLCGIIKDETGYETMVHGTDQFFPALRMTEKQSWEFNALILYCANFVGLMDRYNGRA